MFPSAPFGENMQQMRRPMKQINNLEEKIDRYIPQKQLRNINLRDMRFLPFTEGDLNNAIKDCAQKIN
jgi:hypothetical protein